METKYRLAHAPKFIGSCVLGKYATLLAESGEQIHADAAVRLSYVHPHFPEIVSQAIDGRTDGAINELIHITTPNAIRCATARDDRTRTSYSRHANEPSYNNIADRLREQQHNMAQHMCKQMRVISGHEANTARLLFAIIKLAAMMEIAYSDKITLTMNRITPDFVTVHADTEDGDMVEKVRTALIATVTAVKGGAYLIDNIVDGHDFVFVDGSARDYELLGAYMGAMLIARGIFSIPPVSKHELEMITVGKGPLLWSHHIYWGELIAPLHPHSLAQYFDTLTTEAASHHGVLEDISDYTIELSEELYDILEKSTLHAKKISHVEAAELYASIPMPHAARTNSNDTSLFLRNAGSATRHAHIATNKLEYMSAILAPCVAPLPHTLRTVSNTKMYDLVNTQDRGHDITDKMLMQAVGLPLWPDTGDKDEMCDFRMIINVIADGQYDAFAYSIPMEEHMCYSQSRNSDYPSKIATFSYNAIRMWANVATTWERTGGIDIHVTSTKYVGIMRGLYNYINIVHKYMMNESIIGQCMHLFDYGTL